MTYAAWPKKRTGDELVVLALVKESLPVFNGDSQVERSQKRQVLLNKYFGIASVGRHVPEERPYGLCL
jgi:hypothetical protein